MNKHLKYALAVLSLTGLAGYPAASSAFQAAPASSPSSSSTMSGPTTTPAKKTPSKAGTAAAATPEAIADAKSKGMVWVNLNTKVYHKDDKFYGTTKNGQFMSEADAQKAGAHLAGAHAAKGKAAAAAKQ